MLVPVSTSFFLSLCLSSPSFCAQCCCQSDDLCKSAAKLLGASCVGLCAHACVGEAVLHSQHVLKQGYRLRLPHFGIELFSRPSVTPARCVTDQWLFATDTPISMSTLLPFFSALSDHCRSLSWLLLTFLLLTLSCQKVWVVITAYCSKYGFSCLSQRSEWNETKALSFLHCKIISS